MSKRQPPAKSEFSMTGGIWFVLRHEQHTVAVWVAVVSGKEEVYVDDAQVVASARMSLSSSHTVLVGGKPYTVELKTTKLIEGQLVCTLGTQGVVLAQVQANYTKRKSVLVRLLSIAATIALTFGWMREGWPAWLYAIGLVAIVAATVSWSLYGKGFVFEDVLQPTRV